LLTGKVNETLVPKLRNLPGFAGYYLIEADNGVFSSLGLFETPEQGKESTTSSGSQRPGVSAASVVSPPARRAANMAPAKL